MVLARFPTRAERSCRGTRRASGVAPRRGAVVFTNGVFDLLHPGHIDLLLGARAEGGQLVVGLNSDASVRRLGKGPERPIRSQADRAFVLAALAMVDAVVVFDQDTPLELVRWLEPDVIVKGGDYTPGQSWARPRSRPGTVAW